MKKIISQFWIEISQLIDKDFSDDESKLLDKIYNIFRKYFKNGIAIELYKGKDNIELIFCWWHKKDNIELIKKIIDSKPRINNLDVIWPKSSYWFDFEININNKNIDASKLLFYPLKSNKSEEDLWISLYAKDTISEEILWKILETWIGDELASEISYISLTNKRENEYIWIERLKDYIIWFKKRY